MRLPTSFAPTGCSSHGRWRASRASCPLGRPSSYRFLHKYWRRARSGSAAFGVIDVFEFGVDDALVSRPGASAGAPVRLGRPLYRFAYPHCRSGKRLGALPDPPGIITGHCGPQCGDCLFDGAPLGVAQLIAVLLQVFFGTVDQRVGLVTRLDDLAPPLVLRGMLLGFADHALNICLGETPRGLDADLLLLAGRLVLGRNVHDAIGVDVESDLDLRHAARCRRDTDQVELTQQLVVGGELAFTLEDADRDRRLVVL